MAQTPSILDLFTSFISGFRMVDGGQLQQLISLLFSVESDIVASTTQTQAGARQLAAAINDVGTANANDAVRLPIAILGKPVGIINGTANTIKVFGVAINPITGIGDTIVPFNSTTPAATATGVTQATAKADIYYCFRPGIWKQVQFA